MVETSALNSEDTEERILAELKALIAEFTLSEEGDIDVDDDLMDVGFDSISLLDFLGKVNVRFAISLEPVAILDHPCLVDLTEHMISEYGGPPLADRLRPGNGSAREGAS